VLEEGAQPLMVRAGRGVAASPPKERRHRRRVMASNECVPAGSARGSGCGSLKPLVSGPPCPRSAGEADGGRMALLVGQCSARQPSGLGHVPGVQWVARRIRCQSLVEEMPAHEKAG